MNRKGFTLVELLGVIVIIGLVVGLSSFGIIKVYNNSKEKSLALTNESIKKAALGYSEERVNEDNYWIKKDTNSYFCVTLIELINKGLLKKEKIDKKRYNDYVSVIKNNVTKVIDDTVIASSKDEDKTVYDLCVGNNINETVTKPVIKTITSYTDEIEFEFIDAEVESSIVDRKCAYRDINGIVKELPVGNDNKCQIDNLKNNTDYYELKVCAITSKNSVVCSNPNTSKTKDLKKPTISVNNTVEVSFDDTNIKGTPGHYFKSTLDGNSIQDVLKCKLNNNVFTCEENSTKKIEKDVWYKINGNKVNISYNKSGHGTVTARITDKSNNYKENTKEISVYNTKFMKGDADTINNQNNDIDYYCVAEKNKSCEITSPTAKKIGSTLIGWNTTNGASISTWNPNTNGSVNKDSIYYPVWRRNVVEIIYNVNMGTNMSNNYGVDANGYITINKNCTTSSSECWLKNRIYYGETLGTDGLYNYNNSSYMNIVRSGHRAVPGNEWNCLLNKDCNRTYSQDISYQASDFCDASNGDCRVRLGVNWQPYGDPEIEKIDNSSNGNWTNGNVTLTITVKSPAQASYVTYSYDKVTWYKDSMNNPTSSSGDKYVFKGTWSAERNQTVYLKAVDVNGNESNIKSTNIKIDKTDPKLFVMIYDNNTNIINCDSTNGTTVCEVANSISTTNSIKLFVKDIGSVTSGTNSSAIKKENKPNNTTSYNETVNSSSNFTLSYVSTAGNYQANISISEAGYRIIWITVKDNAGNSKTMKLKIPVGICGISNPNGCQTMYFCREGQTQIHEAAYAVKSGNITEKGITYINASWSAKFHSSVHVVKDTVINNNGNYFYLVCFDNANYASSIYNDNAYYRGAFAQGADGYFFANGIIPFSGINSPKQCGYVYHKCLKPDKTATCTSAECKF